MEKWIQQFINKIFTIKNDNLDIEGAYLLKYSNLPKSVFKYRNFDEKEYNLTNLRNDTIRLSNPLDFNDPYDCSFNVDNKKYGNQLIKNNIDDFLLNYAKNRFNENEISQIKDSHNPFGEMTKILKDKSSQKEQEGIDFIMQNIYPKLNDEILNNHIDSYKDSLKICSFSQINNSLLMWSHYAQNHTGFCIEYEIEKLPYSNYLTRFLYPIVYTDKIFDITQYQLNTLIAKNNNILYMTLSALYKAKGWKYEKEWRLILAHGIAQNTNNYSMPIPKAIYLGAKITDKNKLQVLQIAKEKNIAIFQMTLSNSKFEVIPQTIEESEPILKNK